MNEYTLMTDPLAVFDDLISMPDEAIELQKDDIKSVIRTILNSDEYFEMLAEMQIENPDQIQDKIAGFKEIIAEARADKYSPAKAEIFLYIFETLISSLDEMVKTGGIFKKNTIAFTKVRPDAQVPQYMSIGDAGADIYAAEEVILPAHTTKVIPSGIKVAIPGGYYISIVPRSGLSLKTPLRIPNAPGTIDSTYRGEVGVIMENTSDDEVVIEKGMRIAQMLLLPVHKIVWNEVDELTFEKDYSTDRGAGFGSSGVK